MQIILWRHAEAEDLAPSDLARNLTIKGRKQADAMAAWLRKQMHDDFSQWRIIVSPATRAQQTAFALQLKFETLDSLAPDATAAAVLNAARWPDSEFNVIVVGHQPTLGMVAARLMNGVDGYVNLYRQFDGDALLLDANYLATIFQPAMTEAAERIFALESRNDPAGAGAARDLYSW